jgi:hypothetical protein
MCRVSKVLSLYLLTLLVAAGSAQTSARSAANVTMEAKRSFTVRDDIEMVEFVDSFQTALRSPIKYSPDGRYFAVVTERGLVEKNIVEDTIWVFSTSEITAALAGSSSVPSSSPVSLLKVTAPKAPAIYFAKWMADSSGIAFIEMGTNGFHQLFEINVKDRHLRRLSNANHDVTSFDIQGSHVMYSAVSALAQAKEPEDTLGSVTVGTGLDLMHLVLGKITNSPLQKLKSLCNLWSVANGKAVMVEDTKAHRPVFIHQRPNTYSDPVFRLSPDGRSVAAQLPVDDIPTSWELLPPGDDLPPRRIKVGPQDVRAPRLPEPVNEYAVIDVSSGRTKFQMNAPIGFEDAYYAVYEAVSWASDNRSVVLANTFMGNEIGDDLKKLQAERRPCIAVVNVDTSAMTCAVRIPVTETELAKVGIHSWVGVRFDGGNDNRIVIDARPERPDGGGDYGKLAHLYLDRNADGTWNESGSSNAIAENLPPLEVSVEQSLNVPPRLVARDPKSNALYTLLNPNEKLREVALGSANIFHWEDKQGRKWTGGLVKPPNYTPGVKYPLIMQTHGFEQEDFLSHGPFPSCMAARELAGVGFVVLQIAGPVNEGLWDGTPEEASVEVAGFDGAVDQLSRDGLVNPANVGIIGFSRTVYGVLDALEKGKTKYRAATVCDGIQGGYLEYMMDVDFGNNQALTGYDALTGAPPFGKGLQTWIERSPNFNLDKVTAPLMVQTFGTLSTLFLWEPYAQLRLMKKPVDLIVVNTNDEQHVLSNPRARMASQGTDVDWFRFWLQGYERPNPEDPEQYKRWEHLREMRDADEKATAGQPPAKTINPN